MADAIEKIYCTDSYEGMEFMRWASDAIGKSLTLNWEDFI